MTFSAAVVRRASQLLVVLSNFEHHPPRFGIGQLFSMNARFLGTLAPMSRVVDGNGQACPLRWNACLIWPTLGGLRLAGVEAERSLMGRSTRTGAAESELSKQG
jgi:hypothetical protein